MTDHPTIYSQLEAIAAPVTEQYFTDLTHHDRASIQCATPGDIAFWSPRKCGTHWIWASLKSWRDMPRHDAAAERANSLNWFDAVAVTWASESRKWYRIDCTAPLVGTVAEVTEDAARACMVDLQRQDGMPTAWIKSAYSQTA